MENISKAIERAKGQADRSVARQQHARTNVPRRPDYVSAPPQERHEIELNSAYLSANRIVAHGTTNPFSRPFDMLRTQILQAMDAKNHKIIGITSPTPSCGKTVTAANLALSIVRQPERSALLVDLDFLKPRVATSLGLNSDHGVLSVLEGRSSLADSIIHTRIGSQHLAVLPTAQSWASSEFMASRAMGGFFQDLRRDFSSSTIIVDLPPILSSDDVIAILPQVDCALLVVAVGTTKVSEIEDCTRHLQTTEVLRVVVNKSTDANSHYYYY